MIDANLWDFALITSRMHMAWLRFIGGRLESRYQYSIGIVYNPSPGRGSTMRPKQNSKSLRKPCSTRRRRMRRDARRPLRSRCHAGGIYARRTARSTRRWIASIARSLSRATAKGSSIFSACTKNSPRRCSPPPPTPSAAGKSKGPAAPSRRAVTMTATISNELISTRQTS